MNKINVITIDGPSASGKGFLARKIAKTYRLNILDSGALYRLFAFFVERGHEVNKVSQKIQRDVEFINENEDLKIIYLKENITDELRSEKIALLASKLSAKPEVRQALFDIQRSFYTEKGVVADGRDMGRVVFIDGKL